MYFFVLFCFGYVILSELMCLYDDILQGSFNGTHYQWGNPEGYGYNRLVPEHWKLQQREDHITLEVPHRLLAGGVKMSWLGGRH